MRRFSWTPSTAPPRLSDHAQIEADPRMKCATAAPMVRMRDLSQVVEHVPDAGEIKFPMHRCRRVKNQRAHNEPNNPGVEGYAITDGGDVAEGGTGLTFRPSRADPWWASR